MADKYKMDYLEVNVGNRIKLSLIVGLGGLALVIGVVVLSELVRDPILRLIELTSLPPDAIVLAAVAVAVSYTVMLMDALLKKTNR